MNVNSILVVADKACERSSKMVVVRKVKTAGHVLLALLIVCLAPVSIWVAAGSALYQHRKMKALVKSTNGKLTCSLDSDCPPGHVCLNGYCIPEQSM